MQSPRWLVFALCVLLLVAPACVNVSPWRAQEPPWTSEVVSKATRVRVTQADGTRVVLSEAALLEPSGELRGLEVPAGDEFRVSLDEITILETQRLEWGRVAINGLIYFSIMLVAGLAFTATSGGFIGG